MIATSRLWSQDANIFNNSREGIEVNIGNCGENVT